MIIRHLHIKWQVQFEAMLPIDGKAEEVDVELAGHGFVEDSQYRSDFSQWHTCELRAV
jgi:hypothetical protein